MRKLLFLLLLLPSTVFGQVTFVKYPSTPIQIYSPQGRPIPDAVATVKTPEGVVVVTYTDRTGTTANSTQFTVPFSGIVQFYADPGIYQVEITGSGISRVFYVTAGGGVPSSTRYISIDRTASNLELNTTSPGVLFCDIDKPCVVQLDDDVNRSFRSDWTMPSFPLELLTLSIYFRSDTGNNGNVAAFEVRWCTYAVGETICTPANAVDVSQAVQNDGKRTGLVITQATLNTDWPEDEHVIVEVSRDVSDPDDTVNGMVHVEDVRYEWERE